MQKTRRKRKSKGGAIAAAVFFIIVLLLALNAKKLYKLYLDIFYPTRYSEYVEYYSALNDIDYHFVYAVIKTESGFDENAQSGVGARGLMQMMEETFDWIKYRMKDTSGITYDDMYSPEYNIKYGTYMLALLLEEYGSEEVALAAYHTGRGNVNSWLENPLYSDDGATLKAMPSAATQQYVNKVMKYYEGYSNLYK